MEIDGDFVNALFDFLQSKFGLEIDVNDIDITKYSAMTYCNSVYHSKLSVFHHRCFDGTAIINVIKRPSLMDKCYFISIIVIMRCAILLHSYIGSTNTLLIRVCLLWT